MKPNGKPRMNTNERQYLLSNKTTDKHRLTQMQKNPAVFTRVNLWLNNPLNP